MADRPWYAGLRKVVFALCVLWSLDWLASIRILDGAQYLGALAGLVAAFFGVNYASKAKANG